MILAPLLDYLTLLNSWYVVAIVAALTCLIALTVLLSKREQRPSLILGLLEVCLVVTGFVGLGFVWFALYKSYGGVRYDFWPLSCSIFIAIYASFASLIVSTHWKDGKREIVEAMVGAAFACVFFSPMIVLWIRSFENFHPLWP